MTYVITFEGINACGKSTIIKEIVTNLTNKFKDIEIVNFRCPGSGIPEVRDLLKNHKLNQYSYSMLSMADMFELYHREIKPRLLSNDRCIIILDRFIDSMLVYQGYLGSIYPNFLEEVYKFGVFDFFPDLTFWLDCSYKEIVKRRNSQEGTDIWESGDFKTTCRNLRYGYNELFKRNVNRIVRVNSDLEIDLVYDTIMKVIKDKINFLSMEG